MGKRVDCGLELRATEEASCVRARAYCRRIVVWETVVEAVGLRGMLAQSSKKGCGLERLASEGGVLLEGPCRAVEC